MQPIEEDHRPCCVIVYRLKKEKNSRKGGLSQNFPKGQKRRIFLNKSSSEYGERFPHGTIPHLYMMDVVENDTIYGLKIRTYWILQNMVYDLKGVAQGYALLHEYSD